VDGRKGKKASIKGGVMEIYPEENGRNNLERIWEERGRLFEKGCGGGGDLVSNEGERETK